MRTSKHCLHVYALLLFSLFSVLPSNAQVGEHRDEFALGVNGGYVLSNVGFLPRIPQNMHGGVTGGLTVRYTSEKYFSSICAIVGEVNYARIGWKESILDINDQPVVNPQSNLPEEYQRDMNYIQVPVFARLGWGRERRGMQFFFQAGPQFGLFLSESTKANFDLNKPHLEKRVSLISSALENASDVYHKPAEHKFDYGIAAGLGLEFSNPAFGHIMLEGRYYYGLGDIYGNSKRDYFGRSNFGNIVIKLTYLRDIRKSANSRIK